MKRWKSALPRNYVPSVPEQPVQDNPVEWTEHSFSRHVLNPLLQNIFAGLGMAAIWLFFPELLAIYFSLDYSYDNNVGAASIVGVLFFGALCVFRFSLDEVSAVIAVVAGRLYEIKLAHDITSQVDMYEGQLEQYRAYIKDLKAQLEILGGVTIREPLTQAEIAERKQLAVKLYSRLINNLPITRDECLRVKAFETRGEWATARQYLINAGVIDISGKPLPAAAARGIALIEGYQQTLLATRGKR